MSASRNARLQGVRQWALAVVLAAGSSSVAGPALADPPGRVPMPAGLARLPSLRTVPSPAAAEAPPTMPAQAAAAAEFTRAMHRARQQYEQGRLYEAWSGVRAAREIDPRSIESYRLEAQIALDLKDSGTYLWALQAGLTAAPRLPDDYNRIGKLLVAAGAKDAGLRALRQAVQLAPDDLQYARDLAAAALALGEADTAIDALEQARRRAPDDATLPVALARLHESLRQWSQAVRYYSLAVGNDPDQPLWRHCRARCAYHAGDFRSAYDDYRVCAEAAPLALSEQAHFAEACLNLGDYAQAGATLDSLAAWGVRNRDLELMRSKCYLEAGDRQAARRILRRAVTDWPDDPRLTQMLQLCERRTAEYH